MEKREKSVVNRKEFLAAAGVAAATVASSGLLAEKGHEHHKHHQHRNTKEARVQATALECIGIGETCINHCIELIKNNDNSLVQCMITVQDTIAACQALASLAAANSRFLEELADVCIDICKACEKECRKHEKHHAICRECADSCAKCIKACKAL